MKKLFYFVSAVAVLSSCSNEIDKVAESPVEQNSKIEFTPYVAGQTRTVTSEATLDSLSNGFCVLAWNTTQDTCYFNDIFKYQDGVISAKTDYEWPKSDKLDFRAVYPKEKADVYINPFKEVPQVSDTIYAATYISYDNEDNGTFDVMTAQAKDKDAKSGTIALNFQHLLIKVKVAFKFDATYLIKEDESYSHGPKIKNVSLEGRCSGYYDVSKSKWIDNFNNFADTTALYTLFNGSVSTYGKTDAMATLQEEVYDTETGNKTNEDVCLMVIPGKYQFKLEYGYPTDDDTKYLSCEVDLSSDDLMGKIVTLNVTVTDNRILFSDPTISDWTEGGNIPVE